MFIVMHHDYNSASVRANMNLRATESVQCPPFNFQRAACESEADFRFKTERLIATWAYSSASEVPVFGLRIVEPDQSFITVFGAEVELVRYMIDQRFVDIKQRRFDPPVDWLTMHAMQDAFWIEITATGHRGHPLFKAEVLKVRKKKIKSKPNMFDCEVKTEWDVVPSLVEKINEHLESLRKAAKGAAEQDLVSKQGE